MSPTQDDHWTLRQTLIIFLFVLAVMIPVAAMVTLSEPAGKRNGPLMFSAGLGLLIFLMIRFNRVHILVEKFFAKYLEFTGIMFVTFAPLAACVWLSRFMLERFPLWAQVAVFIVWGMLLSWALLLIATKARRDRLMTSLQNASLAMPIAYSILVLILALLFFSSVTFVMTEHQLLSLKDETGKGVTPGSLSDFFLWHFLEAVPLLDVNQTPKWSAPLTYETATVGWLLLLFKVAVIVPVIGAFTWYWKREKAADDSG